ncbi:MAG: FAD-dependent oxidoreductase, partial [Halobacteria archaeon]|nr:FAD-dependent oxidoreductase [Halobacteria archaeon]
MSQKFEYDVVVAGGGTAGCFAAATTAAEGLNTVLIERKNEEKAGDIACGDALKGKSTFPDVIDRKYLAEEAFTNEHIRRAVFENPNGDVLDIPLPEVGTIVDRKRYGEVLLEETERQGADIHYNTVVQDVVENDNGHVTGVKAKSNGDVREYSAEVVEVGANVTEFAEGDKVVEEPIHDCGH